MRSLRYKSIRTSGGYTNVLSLPLVFATDDESHADYLLREAEIDQRLGREATQKEQRHGVDRPETRRPGDIIAEKRRRERELNPTPVDARTDAERRLDARKEALQAHQNSGPMSTRERLVAESEAEVAAERAAKLEADAREAALGTPKGKRVRADLERLIFLVKFDATVPEQDYSELLHQQALLMKFGDVNAVDQNLRLIQKRLFEGVQASEQELKSHADRISARKEALMVGRDRLDSDPVFTTNALGIRQATLTYLGETVTVPAEQVDGRDSAALVKSHFNVAL